MTKIYVLKWSEIFDEFSKRHEYLLDKLKLEEELWLRKHNSADEVVADAQNNSAIMEMPLATVLSKYHRALKKLKEILSQEKYEVRKFEIVKRRYD